MESRRRSRKRESAVKVPCCCVKDVNKILHPKEESNHQKVHENQIEELHKLHKLMEL